MSGRYRELRIPLTEERRRKETYSVTADVLSYQLCPRQYGFFVHRKYIPAHVVQVWYGKIIHQVLDKLHMHYRGHLNPEMEGQLPTDEDVDIYFTQVNNSLRAHGLHAINRDLIDRARSVLINFNRIEGTHLYPHILDTECNLQNNQGDYILEGVVDVLRSTQKKGRKRSQYEPVEIWDYKGSQYPDIRSESGRRKLDRYEYQMYVYAGLFHQKYGKYPLNAKLYFMNELHSEGNLTERPQNAIHKIDLTNPDIAEKVHEAIDIFSQTVREIEDCKQNNLWRAPENMPDMATCTICDIRWNCPAARHNFPLRYP